MVEARQYSESEGTLSKDAEEMADPCPKCGGPVEMRFWESSCGGYEDEKHTCRSCGFVRWVDGPDS
jgi:ssDNA-binding Zn-finger/Zn-ribbon topoisomerase 1